MNPSSLVITVVNRHPSPVDNVAVSIVLADLRGEVLLKSRYVLTHIGGNGALTLPADLLVWPRDASPSSVYFVQLQIESSSLSSLPLSLPSTYWLNNPRTVHQDYSALGLLRKSVNHAVVRYTVTSTACDRSNGPSLLAGGSEEQQVCAEVSIECDRDSPSVAVSLRLTLLHDNSSLSDDRVLPTFYSHNFFTLLPGQQISVLLAARTRPSSYDTDSKFVVEVSGWNVGTSKIQLK